MSTESTTPTNGSSVAAGVSSANGQTSAGDTPATTAVLDAPREKLTKKAITADHPTWCPGCPECFRGARQNQF
jgi:TPP-dependent indolepyruvate ferredoxin oxidoreductase alpha subunit